MTPKTWFFVYTGTKWVVLWVLGTLWLWRTPAPFWVTFPLLFIFMFGGSWLGDKVWDRYLAPRVNRK